MREAIKTLEQKQNDWNTAVNTVGRGISADDHQALTQAATAYNTALGQAKESLKRIEDLSGSDIDALKEQVKTFKEKTAPTVNDGTNGQANEIPDSVDNAMAKLKAAEAAKQDLNIAKRNAEPIYNVNEVRDINAKVDAFNTALTSAKNAVKAAEREAITEDGLDTKLRDLGSEETHVVANDKNNNGKLDTDDALEALNLAETAKNKMVTTLGSFGKGISPSEKQIGDGYINEFNTKKGTAKAILDLVETTDPKYRGLFDKYEKLGSQALLNVTDHNGNDKPDSDDYRDALEKIKQARDAKTLYDQYMREVGGAVDPDEYKQIKEQADIYKNALEDAKIWHRSFSHSESNYRTELDKQLITFGRDTLDVPAMNDSNSNDVPDSDEVNRVVSRLESTEGRNAKKDSLSVTVSYPGYGDRNGKMFNAIERGEMGRAIEKFEDVSGDGRPRRMVIVAKQDSQLSIAEHFGVASGRPNNNLPIEYKATKGDNNLLIGGDATGDNNTNSIRFHSVEFGNGNDTMLVGIGNRDLKVGVYKSGENIGKMIAKLGDGFNGSDIENIDFAPGYFAENHIGYLEKFESMKFGAGNDNLVVKQDAKRVSIDLGTGDDYMFIGGAFGDGIVNAGSGNDRLTFDRIGVDFGDATVITGEDNDIVTVNKILNTNIVVDLGAGDDTFILKGDGIRGYSINNRGIKGGDGFDTFIVDMSKEQAQKDYGLTSKMIQGFEKINFVNAGFFQLTGQDLLDANLALTNGRKVLRVESEEWFEHTWLNLGSQTYMRGYAHGNPDYPNFADNGGTWRKNGTHTEMVGNEEREYDVYTFTSTTGAEADVWVYGMFHVV